MKSCFEQLAIFIESQSWAMLTTFDVEFGLHTRPVRSMQAPFAGQIWLDGAAAEEIGDGAEVSLAFGDASRGPYVTVSGWAILTPARAHAQSSWQYRPQSGSGNAAGRHLFLCITASAAKMWESAARGPARVFAFPPVQPLPVADDTVPPTFAPSRRSLPASTIARAL